MEETYLDTVFNLQRHGLTLTISYMAESCLGVMPDVFMSIEQLALWASFEVDSQWFAKEGFVKILCGYDKRCWSPAFW